MHVNMREVGNITMCTRHRAFRLDILHVLGPNPDGVQLADLELFALRQQ